MSIQQSISKPVGPLPLWGWGVVGSGLILAYIYLNRSKSDTSSTSTWTDTTDTSGTSDIPGGSSGPMGPAGPAGATGEKGDTGEQGEKGDTGARGPAGKIPKMPVCKAGYDPYWTGSKWVCRRDNPKKKKGNHNDPVVEMTALTMPAPNNAPPTVGYDAIPAPSHYPPSNIAQGDQYSRMNFGVSRAKFVEAEPTDETLVTKVPIAAAQRAPGRPWYPG